MSPPLPNQPVELTPAQQIFYALNYANEPDGVIAYHSGSDSHIVVKLYNRKDKSKVAVKFLPTTA